MDCMFSHELPLFAAIQHVVPCFADCIKHVGTLRLALAADSQSEHLTTLTNQSVTLLTFFGKTVFVTSLPFYA